MKQKELKQLASKMKDLEQKCQNGENISENMTKMAELCKGLSLEDLLQLDEVLSSIMA